MNSLDGFENYSCDAYVRLSELCGNCAGTWYQLIKSANPIFFGVDALSV